MHKLQYWLVSTESGNGPGLTRCGRAACLVTNAHHDSSMLHRSPCKSSPPCKLGRFVQGMLLQAHLDGASSSSGSGRGSSIVPSPVVQRLCHDVCTEILIRDCSSQSRISDAHQRGDFWRNVASLFCPIDHIERNPILHAAHDSPRRCETKSILTA